MRHRTATIVLVLTVALPALTGAVEPWSFRVVDDTGLPQLGMTFGGTWADLDRDGRWDLVLSRHADDHVEIYLGRDGLAFSGPASWPHPTGLLDHHGTAACDHDGDGAWDLYLTAGADRGHGQSCKHLWLTRGDEEFHGVIDCRHLLADPAGRGRGGLWLRLTRAPRPQLLVLNYDSPARLFEHTPGGWQDRAAWFDGGIPACHVAEAHDFDGDGRLDLFTAGSERQLWHNQDGRLLPAPAEALPTRIPAVSDAAGGDVDGDGDIDLLLGLRGGALWLLMNESTPGRMRFGELVHTPVLPQVDEPVTVELADLDNDGHLDLLVAQRRARGGGRPVVLARGRGDGRFEPPQRLPAPASRAMALWAIDLDRDGDLDLVVCNGEEQDDLRPDAVVVYENTAAGAGITVELDNKPDQAPHGLGASVTVTANGRDTTQRLHSTANPWNSTVLPLHFGVESTVGPLKIVVEWPDGGCQELTLPAAGCAYRIGRDGQVATIP